jgi:hypothetical protein
MWIKAMAREKHDKPHPTPHPDAPHISGAARDTGPGASPSEEVGEDEPNYDSCLDDLDKVLSDSPREPDPVLESSGTSQALPPPPFGDSAAARASSPVGKPPRTSEVFRATGVAATETTSELSRTARTSRSADPAAVRSGQPAVSTREGTLRRTEHKTRATPGSDDDHLVEPGIPWFSLLLLSYSSLVTLALTWMFWTGRVFNSTESPPAASPQPASESVAKSPEAVKPSALLPPIPPDNFADLGQTIRIGELEVTPIAVVAAPVDLVRSIDPGNWRREETDSLVLRLKLTNVSVDQIFAPLELNFVRDQSSPLDRSMITGSTGATIGLYPLANDSEWSIQGQDFAVLKPDESAETIIVTEPGAGDRVAGEMTWRVRLRIGTYRTDMVGVRFHRGDLGP